MVHTFALRSNQGHRIELPKPVVMGIVNASANSFYNPPKNFNDVLNTANRMVAEGAHFLDIGGEATNPSVDISSESPSVQMEIDRVLPVIEAVKKRFDVLISVDTSRPAVMQAAVNVGADMINDQRALSLPNAMQTVAKLETPVCLMHFTDRAMSRDPKTLLNTIKNDLATIIDRCKQQGITEDRMVIDPGFGQGNYGKTCAENFYLLAHLQELVNMGFPVLIGWSRKSMIGDVLGGVPPEERLFGSLAAETLAAFQGASIIRTHDVKAVCDAVRVVQRMAGEDLSYMDLPMKKIKGII